MTPAVGSRRLQHENWRMWACPAWNPTSDACCGQQTFEVDPRQHAKSMVITCPQHGTCCGQQMFEVDLRQHTKSMVITLSTAWKLEDPVRGDGCCGWHSKCTGETFPRILTSKFCSASITFSLRQIWMCDWCVTGPMHSAHSMSSEYPYPQSPLQRYWRFIRDLTHKPDSLYLEWEVATFTFSNRKGNGGCTGAFLAWNSNAHCCYTIQVTWLNMAWGDQKSNPTRVLQVSIQYSTVQYSTVQCMVNETVYKWLDWL